MSYFFRGRMLSLQMVDHLFIDVTLLKRPIVYLENGRPLQTTTAEGVDMRSDRRDRAIYKENRQKLMFYINKKR